MRSLYGYKIEYGLLGNPALFKGNNNWWVITL